MYDGRKDGGVEKNFSLTLGAKMLPYDGQSLYFKRTLEKSLYLFSGQTLKPSLASNINICQPDLYNYDPAKNSWKLVETKCDKKLQGRKNYAFSQSKDFLFVTGGTTYKETLADFLHFNIHDSRWKYLIPVMNVEFLYRKVVRNLLDEKSEEPSVRKSNLKAAGLLKRSNHSIVSVFNKSTQLEDGDVVHEWTHYLFGGLIDAPYKKDKWHIQGSTQTPRIVPTNDVLELKTKYVMVKRRQDHYDKETVYQFAESKKVIVYPLTVKGIKPMPRCDHNCQLINNNKIMLIYGGRNEFAYGKEGAVGMKPSVELDDIMLFNI